MDDIGPLKRYRLTTGMSHADMLDKLGMDRGTLSRIDRGLRWPSREQFEAIIKITDGSVTPSDFMAPTTSDTEPARAG